MCIDQDRLGRIRRTHLREHVGCAAGTQCLSLESARFEQPSDVFCVAIHIVEIYRDIGDRQQLSKIADDLVFVLVSVVIYRLRDEARIRVRQVLRYCVNRN